MEGSRLTLIPVQSLWVLQSRDHDEAGQFCGDYPEELDLSMWRRCTARLTAIQCFVNCTPTELAFAKRAEAVHKDVACRVARDLSRHNKPIRSIQVIPRHRLDRSSARGGETPAATSF
jgi:hypothetical protein